MKYPVHCKSPLTRMLVKLFYTTHNLPSSYIYSNEVPSSLQLPTYTDACEIILHNTEPAYILHLL